MDINNPFETFTKSAFRLEGLPQYRVAEEIDALIYFNKYGKIPDNFGNDWANLVLKNASDGKSMERLRLVSEPLSNYENFELRSYLGVVAGEKIHIANRDDYDYKYDFWFFDNKWITRMNYSADGSFIDSETSKANKSEIDMFNYWYGVYKKSKMLD